MYMVYMENKNNEMLKEILIISRGLNFKVFLK